MSELNEEELVDEEEIVEESPKKKRNYKGSSKPITGRIKSDDFTTSVSDINKDSYIDSDSIVEILTDAMKQAYLEWSYPGLFKDKDSTDPAKELIKCEITFSNAYNKFTIYDIKTVTEEDDIVDDSYQISLEDALKIKPTAKIGDEIKIKFDVTKLDKQYVRRVKQLFQAKQKEASKAAILSVYQDKIGELIEGTVTRIENDVVELSFGKANGTLRKGNKLPSDHFVVGDKVLVYLSNVSDKNNPPSLVISRTNKEFVQKLLESCVPEIKEGYVTIKACEREFGKRTKIFVDSTNPNIDPVGTCIGPESSRIRTVTEQLGNEKVDIVRYYLNKAMQVVEAMKPANVVGLICPEDLDFFDPNIHYEEFENDRDYEYPKITAVVANGNQGVAIGTGGVNVRLASKITHCTISVLQQDDAITTGSKIIMCADIIKMVKGLTSEEIPSTEEVVLDDEEFNEESVQNEDVIPTDAEVKPIVSTTPVVEETKADIPTQSEEVKTDVEETAVKDESFDAVKAAKEEIKPVEKEPEVIEHVEIKNKPRISLEEIEEALSSKKGPSSTRSYKRKKKDEDKDEVAPSEASKAEAMPIYTEEELKQMDEDNLEDEEDYEDDSDFDQYDSDEYYKN